MGRAPDGVLSSLFVKILSMVDQERLWCCLNDSVQSRIECSDLLKIGPNKGAFEARSPWHVVG